MNYIIANSVCCCLQCCCKQIFQTLYKLLGKTSFIKIMYLVIYVSFITILLTAFAFLRDWSFFMDYIARGISCSSADDFDCITVSLVYRMVTSISLFIIFVLLIMSLCTTRVSHILNQGLFFSKFVTISLVFFVLLQFDNSLYQQLSIVYEYISYLFLICQGIIIIDLGYLWGIKWADKYSRAQTSGKYGVLLIVFSVGMFGTALFLNIYGYILVSHERQYMQSSGMPSQCSNLPNILNTVFIVLMIIIQLLNYNKQNSLLTTTFMCIYISFWCFSSIYSSNKCNLNHDSLLSPQQNKHYSKAQFYFYGTCTSVFWLLLSTYGSVFGSTNRIQDQSNGQQIQFVELQEHHKENTKSMIEGRQNQHPNDNYYSGQNKKNWLIWHLFMLVMIVNLSMLLTDWGSRNLITGKYSMNQNAYNSKIFMACFAFTAYIWTLVAPCIFPQRTFYFV